MYRKLAKLGPPFCTHYFEAKVGRGHLLKYLISFHTYASPTIPQTIVTTAEALWMNGSFDGRVLQEISGDCVETKPRGTEATFIVSGNGKTSRKFAIPV